MVIDSAHSIIATHNAPLTIALSFNFQMLIQIKFFFFFWLFPTIKLIATLENEKFDGIGWAAAKEKGGKFFDDPYLGAEKGAI